MQAHASAGDIRSADDDPGTSSGKTSQASAPEARGGTAGRTGARVAGQSFQERGHAGSSLEETYRKSTFLADLAQRLLPGAGRLSADKRAFSKERSLATLHGGAKGGRAKSKGTAQGRGGAQGHSTMGEGSRRAAKLPKPEHSAGTPLKRKRADEKMDAAASFEGSHRKIFDEDAPVKAEAVKGEEEVRVRGTVSGLSTSDPRFSTGDWRCSSSLGNPSSGSDDSGKRKQTLAASAAPRTAANSRETTPAPSDGTDSAGQGVGPPSTPSQPSCSRPSLISWPEAGPIVCSGSQGAWPLREPHADSLRMHRSRKWREKPPKQLEGAADTKAEEHSGRSTRRKAVRDSRDAEDEHVQWASSSRANGTMHPAHDRVWPPSMRERELSPERDWGTNSIWGEVPSRRRSGYELREVPVSANFYIMGIAQPDFQMAEHEPFVTPFPLEGPDKWRGVSPPRLTSALRKNPAPFFPE